MTHCKFDTFLNYMETITGDAEVYKNYETFV